MVIDVHLLINTEKFSISTQEVGQHGNLRRLVACCGKQLRSHGGMGIHVVGESCTPFFELLVGHLVRQVVLLVQGLLEEEYDCIQLVPGPEQWLE